MKSFPVVSVKLVMLIDNVLLLQRESILYPFVKFSETAKGLLFSSEHLLDPKMRVSAGPYLPMEEQNLLHCPYTKKYGSVKAGILAYFTRGLM